MELLTGLLLFLFFLLLSQGLLWVYSILIVEVLGKGSHGLVIVESIVVLWSSRNFLLHCSGNVKRILARSNNLGEGEHVVRVRLRNAVVLIVLLPSLGQLKLVQPGPVAVGSHEGDSESHEGCLLDATLRLHY